MSAAEEWAGAWVAERLDLVLRGAQNSPVAPAALVGLALRHNPRRAHLLVSTVLGKHIPVDPRLVAGAGRLLGMRVAQLLSGDPSDTVRRATELFEQARRGSSAAAAELLELPYPHRPVSPVTVLSYAETATALGHCVGDTLGAESLHSTRRPVDGLVPVVVFDEAHSHATRHLLTPRDPAFFARSSVLVLVDDELSTGSTMIETITAVHARYGCPRYILATLVDVRGAADRARLYSLARQLGVQIDVVALGVGELDLPADVLVRGAALVANHHRVTASTASTARLGGEWARAGAGWPRGVREGGRHGFDPADTISARAAATAVAAAVVGQLSGNRIHVLGFEELMYAPLLIALSLAEQSGGGVSFSSTTRSPVLAIDEPGYAIRTSITFASHDDPVDGPGPRYAYNLRPGQFTDLLLVLDEAGDTEALHRPGGLIEQLSGLVDRLHLVTLPILLPALPLRGPNFGSYPAADVAWLLSDLSEVELEAPTEEREEAVQSGGAHYAESLPIEYQPDAEYQNLYHAALDRSAENIALGVGLMTELILRERGSQTVLVSLARAGTPIGVLARRWALFAHQLDLAHYAVSIVRGRGLDPVALQYLASHHDPTAVMFVDGWTGKGAITRELTAAIEAANADLDPAQHFSPQLAALADPGECAHLFGTREDILIPSACLNSTVSGLVSRTVLNSLIGPGQFHGAKFYRKLAADDVSAEFIDTIVGYFPAVLEQVMHQRAAGPTAEHRPTGRGWAAVEAISAAFGIDDVNLIKPGIGETTRVLLRRVPWKILVRPNAETELAHIRLLARQRGVDVVEYADMPFNCVGLIHPRFTRGATGSDGRSVRT